MVLTDWKNGQTCVNTTSDLNHKKEYIEDDTVNDVYPQKILEDLQSRITSKLSNSGVFQEVRGILQEYLAKETNTNSNVTTMNENLGENCTIKSIGENSYNSNGGLSENPRLVLDHLIRSIQSQQFLKGNENQFGREKPEDMRAPNSTTWSDDALHKVLADLSLSKETKSPVQNNTKEMIGNNLTYRYDPSKLYMCCKIIKLSGLEGNPNVMEFNDQKNITNYQLHLAFGKRQRESTRIYMALDDEIRMDEFCPFIVSNLPISARHWEDVIRQGYKLHFCLTQNIANDTLSLPSNNFEDGSSNRFNVIKNNPHLNRKYSHSVGDLSRELVATAEIDWRQVLLKGGHPFNIELKGCGNAALLHNSYGFLNIQLTLHPLQVPFATPCSILEVEETLSNDNLTLQNCRKKFYSYTKTWWNEYKSINPVLAGRPVKVFAPDEKGQQRFVCSFIKPLQVPTGVFDGPSGAARYVALLPFERQIEIGGDRSETWHSFHSIVSRGKGDVEDHAILLCSLLLAYGLDAYVCIGEAKEKNCSSPKLHTWVMTRTSTNKSSTKVFSVEFWESLTGQKSRIQNKTGRGQLSLTNWKYHSVHCVFNHVSFFANKSLNDNISKMSFDFTDSSTWKGMNQAQVSKIVNAESCYGSGGYVNLKSPVICVDRIGEAIEKKLADMIIDFRANHAADTVFDSNLSYLLAPALAGYEMERCGNGIGSTYLEDFQNAIRRTVPTGHCFKGFPTFYNHLNVKEIFKYLSNGSSPSAQEVLLTRGDHLKFALRARVYPYAEDTVAVWVMICAIYENVNMINDVQQEILSGK